MRPGWIAAAAIAVFGMSAAGAKADDSAAWLKDRQTRFAAYHAARTEGGPGDDVTTVIRPMERASGVELHATPNT